MAELARRSRNLVHEDLISTATIALEVALGAGNRTARPIAVVKVAMDAIEPLMRLRL